MKQTIAAALFLAFMSGCFPLRSTKDDALMQTMTPPPAVTADQVTNENAYEMAQALWDELDREAQQSTTTPIGPHTPRRR